jgi:hypothetical protein
VWRATVGRSKPYRGINHTEFGFTELLGEERVNAKMSSRPEDCKEESAVMAERVRGLV